MVEAPGSWRIGTDWRIHMVGVAGSGMSGLAKLLAQQGHSVSGSDLRLGPHTAPLSDLGIDIWSGHRPELAGDWDVLIASSAVPPSDPEVRAAEAAGIPVWERPDLLEAMTNEMPAIGFTGTHGKTSSTGLAVAGLRSVGEDPTFMVGGQLTDLGTNAHLGNRDLFVLEADEAFGTFLRLQLTGLLVTNVEADHLDYYQTPENVLRAFQDVAERVEGPVVVCADDEGARQVLDGAITYGFLESADWRVGEVSNDTGRAAFTVTSPQGQRIPVLLSKPGKHMALNAAGVLALMAQFGFDPDQLAAGFASFAGIGRRYELRGTIGGVEVIDDYAHHPTEIEATVLAARAGKPSRLVVVFQPHRYTRTAEHAVGLGAALSSADVVVVTDVYSAHELPIPGVSGESVALAAESAGANVIYEPTRSALAKTVAEVVESGDRLLTLGAGDITQLPDELFEVMTGNPV